MKKPILVRAVRVLFFFSTCGAMRRRYNRLKYRSKSRKTAVVGQSDVLSCYKPFKEGNFDKGAGGSRPANLVSWQFSYLRQLRKCFIALNTNLISTKECEELASRLFDSSHQVLGSDGILPCIIEMCFTGLSHLTCYID